MAKIGDNVKVHYTGRLEDGSIFDSSLNSEPLQFTVGSNMVIPGFDNAVIGMALGESKTIHIPMDEAYGPYLSELVQEVSRNDIPPDVDLQVGQRLQAQREDGQLVVITVIEISESTIKLDANHPLAGKDLVFDIELIEIC